MACSSESFVSALSELELSELEKEQIVIVIPPSLPPGSTPPLAHPHPSNVVTIIFIPRPRSLRSWLHFTLMVYSWLHFTPMATLMATICIHGYTYGYILHSQLHLRLHFTLMATLRATFYTHGYTHGYYLHSWLHLGLHFTLPATLAATFYSHGPRKCAGRKGYTKGCILY